MDVSIIILNYKTKGLVKQCIRNVMVSTADLNYEIIVVDNDSNDGIEQMLKEYFPETRFLQTGKNLGFAAGNNVGMRKAKGKYIMVLNPDVTVLNGSLKKMVQFMDENTEVSLAGPKLINPDGSYQVSCRTFTKPMHVLLLRTPLGKLPVAKKYLDEHLMVDYDRVNNKEVDWLHGACLLARQSALEKVGLLDERFFMYVEDLDWARRFWLNEYKVFYIAEAEMVHLLEKASDHGHWKFWKLDKLTRWHLTSYFKYIAKYLGVKNNGRK